MSVVTVSTFNKKFQFPPQPSHLLATLWQVPRRLNLSERRRRRRERERKKKLISYFKVIKSDRGSLQEGAKVTLRCAALAARRIPPSLSAGVFNQHWNLLTFSSNRCQNIKCEKKKRVRQAKWKKSFANEGQNGGKRDILPAYLQRWFCSVREPPTFKIYAVDQICCFSLQPFFAENFSITKWLPVKRSQVEFEDVWLRLTLKQYHVLPISLIWIPPHSQAHNLKSFAVTLESHSIWRLAPQSACRTSCIHTRES